MQAQNNNIFSAILANVKLEKLQFAHTLNNIAVKTKRYEAAHKAAFDQLIILRFEVVVRNFS